MVQSSCNVLWCVCGYEGLCIVRCCDGCDIVGSIKSIKELRGAHWHCYRCRNGFSRRDEAIKHYRTHFRSPETTYQIQIVSVSFCDIIIHAEHVVQSAWILF